MNIGSFLDVTAARYPDREAIVFGERSTTYRDLQERVTALAAGLTASEACSRSNRRVRPQPAPAGDGRRPTAVHRAWLPVAQVRERWA